MARLIFVTGGVVSSLGKGLTSASLALLFQKRGYKISQLKMDPYINVDPGTMSPLQHGEVFVTEDGGETDLDLGHYERFSNQNVTSKANITSGKIYERVLAKERKGEYLGGTVQVIPHITNEIKKHILEVSKDADLTLVEIGGTVGDIESLPFLESIRQLKFDLGSENVCYLHLTLVPYIGAAKELKTKPTQHSVQELRRIGIQPDFVICRLESPLPKDLRDKIALFANVPTKQVISAHDVTNIYQLPLLLAEQQLDALICEHFSMRPRKADLNSWKRFVKSIEEPKHKVKIAVVGKYTGTKDSYISLQEALVHASAFHKAKLQCDYIDATRIEKHPELLKNYDGILIPGGFGSRGIEGKIKAIEYARTSKVPCFGICLGMQMMAIEFARHMAALPHSHSGEFVSQANRSKHSLIIDYMEGQAKKDKGGTMRLGSYPCELSKKTLAYKAYGSLKITERHRHRLEFQNKFRKTLEAKGMVFSGVFKKQNLVEIVEYPNHPWFVGCQFHPEFKSRPETPHPLFRDFLGAALKRAKS